MPTKVLVDTKMDSRLPPNWLEGRRSKIDFGGPAGITYDADLALGFETWGGLDVVEEAARRYPQKLAVYDGTTRLTYQAFMDRVWELASSLIATAEPQAVVASISFNSAASPIIVMACAIAGCILVPVDASHPIERQHAIVSEAGAELILLVRGEEIDASAIPASIPLFIVDPLAVTNAVRPQSRYDPSQPSFVSFTSGSTGRPKGLVSNGRSGGELLRNFTDMFHLNASDVVLGLASLSTGGARDAFAALGAGATCRIYDMRSHGVAGALQILAQENVTILSFVPSALRMILGIGGAEHSFRTLRILDLHGERILASDIALFRQKLPSTCHISVTMGSVEAGAVFSWFVRDELCTGPVVPVGYPMPGRRVALLDGAGLPVADGEIGELLVSGAMAIGGWQQGRQVKGPFLCDPDHANASIYAMGDLLRRRADGLFEFAGRNDRKVKIRGLWADLGEVEAAMRTLQGVSEAVAVTIDRGTEAESLVVFITMDLGRSTPPSLAQARRAVAELTAAHMAPKQLRVLAQIPRLGNFKPDLVLLGRLAEDSA